MTISLNSAGDPIQIGRPSLLEISPPVLLPRLGLIRAWDMNAVSGNDVTSVPPAFGTAVALTVGGTSGSADINPDVSPAGNNLLQTTGSNSEIGSFTSTGAMSNWTIAFVYAPTGLTGTTPVPIISKSSSSTQSYLQWNVTSGQIFQLEYRPDSGSAATFALDTGQLINNGACYVCIIRRQSGLGLTVRVNTVQKTLAVGAAFTFDQIFKAKGTNFATALWGRFAIWNRALSDGECSAVETSLGDDISRGLFISDSIGNDTTGLFFSAATPGKTVAAALGKTQIITNGLAIGNFGLYGKPADTFSIQPITPPVSGSTLFKFIVDSWDGVTPFNAYGCGSTVGGWVDNLDGTFSRALIQGAAPSFVQLRTLSSSEGLLYEKLLNDSGGGGAQPASSYRWAANLLTIKPPGYFVAATTEVRINDGNRCFDFSTFNLILRNVNAWFWTGIACRPAATAGTIVCQFLDCSYGNDDGMDTNTGPSCTVSYTDCAAHSNGSNPVQSGQGDGFSAHSSGVVNYNRIRAFYNGTGGLLSEAHTVENCNAGYFKGNARDVIRLQQGTGSNGSLTITNTIVELTAASSTENCIEFETGLTGCTYVLDFITLVNNGGSASTSIAISINGGAGGEVKNCIIDGLHGGVIGTSGATGTEDYNTFHNVNTTVSGGGITSGGHSFTADPLFTNPGAEDYTLQGGSPCIGAGIAIPGITTDYTGATRANPPTIGAYET